MVVRYYKILVCCFVLLMMTACSLMDFVGAIDFPPQVITLSPSQCRDCGDPNCNCDSQATGLPSDLTVIAAAGTLTASVPSQMPSPVISETPTELPSPTPILTSTATPEPTQTPTATIEPTVTPTPEPPPFNMQSGSPVYTRNFYYEDKNCNWMGVGGQVLDASGKWMNNMVIAVQGEADGKKYDLLSMSGAAPHYGPGGYEIVISDTLFNSAGQLTITLKDLAGEPLSQHIPFSTFDDCDKSLILINFQQRLTP